MIRTIIIYASLGAFLALGSWALIRPTLQWAALDGTYVPKEPPVSRMAGLSWW